MTLYRDRAHCYKCYRPVCSCICHAVSPVETQSCFVILMHQKEYRKTKNGTGHMTHLSLPHSHLFIGIDFTHHEALNALIQNPKYRPFVLYPDTQAHNLSYETLALESGVVPLFILIDSTWACSKKMLRLSHNLRDLPKVSFTAETPSNFEIKKQPQEYCLSTIESTQKILTLLQNQGRERVSENALKKFLQPFQAMVSYQIEAARQHVVRYR